MARTLLGGVAVQVHAARTGVVRIGLSSDSGTVALELRSSDLARFTDSVSRRLSPGRRRMGWTFRVEEPGVGAGVLSLGLALSRDGRDSAFALFASDELLSNVRERVTLAECRVLVRHLRRAVAATTTPPRRTGR